MPLRERSGFNGIKVLERKENLIRCLANFKAQIKYKNIDFNGDKVKQYRLSGKPRIRRA